MPRSPQSLSSLLTQRVHEPLTGFLCHQLDVETLSRQDAGSIMITIALFVSGCSRVIVFFIYLFILPNVQCLSLFIYIPLFIYSPFIYTIISCFMLVFWLFQGRVKLLFHLRDKGTYAHTFLCNPGGVSEMLAFPTLLACFFYIILIFRINTSTAIWK